MNASVAFGERTVGTGNPVLVVAEVGVNHDGDLATALELVDAAAEAGADAVKFQTFDVAQLVTSTADLAAYQRERAGKVESQREMLAALELGAEQFAEIAEQCIARDIVFLSTPFDLSSAALLADLGVPGFKIGSGELTNLPFLCGIAAYGLPLLVSTGMATLEEVRDAVNVITAEGAPLILLHCVSSYPAPPDEANLRAIDTLRDAFGVPVGYSDHSLGFDVSLAAVARDACILERHFTLDRRRTGPDHRMSLEPRELSELVVRVRAVEASLGNGQKQAQPSEIDMRITARRSIVAARALKAGEKLTADSLAVKRPGGGVAPGRLHSMVGRSLTRALRADEQLSEADLEQEEEA